MATALTIDQRVDQIKERTGSEQVERINLDIATMSEQGVFCDIDTSGFSKLDTRPSWREFGVNLPEEITVKVRAPSVGLLTEKWRPQLARPAMKCYELLQRYSLRLTSAENLLGLSGYRWVPWTAWESFDEAYQLQVTALEEVKDALLGEYQAERVALHESFLVLAEQSATRFTRMGVDIGEREDFVLSVVSALYKHVPSEDFIRHGLTIHRRIGVVSFASDRQREHLRHIENEREAKIKETLYQMTLDAERERIENALSPLDEAMSQVYSVVYQAAKDMAGSLEKNGVMMSASVRRARELASWFHAMNWRGSDDKLGELIDRLQTLAEQPVRKYPTKAQDVTQVLDEIKRAASEVRYDANKPLRKLEL